MTKIGCRRHQFLECVKWKIGRGNRIHFWDDVWIEEGSLKNLFPRKYVIAQRKNMMVKCCFTRRKVWVDGICS